MTVQERIIQALKTGENNAVSLADMCRVSGINNRATRQIIEDLRRSGVVIISSNKGYYLPETLEEVRHYINKESKRAKSIFYTIQSAKVLEKKMIDSLNQTMLSESEGI